MMTGKKKGTKTCDERQNTEVKLVTRSKNAEMKISLHVERVRDRTRNFDGQLDILSKQIIQLRAIKLVARARLVAPLKQEVCETKESNNRDYGRRANTPNSLNQREIFKFALMETKTYNSRNSRHDI